MGLRIHYRGTMRPEASCMELQQSVFSFAQENGLFHPMSMEAHCDDCQDDFDPAELGRQLKKIFPDMLPEGHELMVEKGEANWPGMGASDPPGEISNQDMMLGLYIEGSILQIHIAGGRLLEADFPRDPVPVTTHMMVVELLRHIAPFFSELEVLDEGGYWATRDLCLLQDRRDQVDRLINSFREVEAKRQ